VRVPTHLLVAGTFPINLGVAELRVTLRQLAIVLGLIGLAATVIVVVPGLDPLWGAPVGLLVLVGAGVVIGREVDGLPLWRYAPVWLAYHLDRPRAAAWEPAPIAAPPTARAAWATYRRRPPPAPPEAEVA
jgi:hypothetical protein